MQLRLGLLTASHAGEAHPALPGHRTNPRGVLPALPNPPLPRLRLRLPDPRARSESHRRTGAHRARRRCFSFKKKPSPLASGGCGLNLQQEDSSLRLRAGSPVQSLPGIVVSLGPERLPGILLSSLLLLLASLPLSCHQASCSIHQLKPTRALSEPLDHPPAAAHNLLPSTREVA